MQRFRRLFALLFILSLMVGIVHEMHHDHHGEGCEVCVLAHAPAVLSDPAALSPIIQSYEPFESPRLRVPALISILSRSRSPPLIQS